jgi:hypothetical protein
MVCDWITVLWVVGILAALEALVSLFFSKAILNMFKGFGKWKVKKLRGFAWFELLIAIVLILLAIYL